MHLLSNWIIQIFVAVNVRTTGFDTVDDESKDFWSPEEPEPRLWDAAQSLVERFDIEPSSDFSAKCANFIGLVLFCIDAKFCKKYSLESSWRDLPDLKAFAPLRPQYLSKDVSNLFAFFGKIFPQNAIFQHFASNFAQIWMKFRRNFADKEILLEIRLKSDKVR